MKSKRIISFLLCTLLMSAFIMQTVSASDTQVFVDEYRLNHFIEKDGRIYLQAKELSHYIGYDIEYDAENSIASLYKSKEEKPILKRESSIYPTYVDELEFENRREIVKVYELSESENPAEISKSDFEKNGYIYSLSDITKSSKSDIDTKEYTEVVEVVTSTNDINKIIAEISETKDFTTDDGYKGILKLDIATIKTDVTGYKNSSYTVSEVRQYPNYSEPDTSLLPKTITVNGKALNFASVDWKKSNTETIDYDQLADRYTAVVTYTGTGTKSSVKGYITSVEYKGTVSKELYGRTIYTAYFMGRKIKEPEPTIIEKPREMTKKEMIDKLAEIEKQEKINSQGIGLNPLVIFIVFLILAILGFLLYFFLFRGNVVVHSTVDENFAKIGRTKIINKNKNYIIDLTSFTSEVTTPTFLLLINRFSAKMLDGKTVNINYGSKNFQHKIEINEHNKGKKYQFEVDF